MGRPVPPKGPEAWDSNVITPGTPFMLGLSDHLRHYIRLRLSTEPAWRELKVIFSDASIPGEGEHKIMSHIRCQRATPNYDPNTVHCLHGLDADLIMLALATHELNFYILREEVLFGRRGAEQAQSRREASGHAAKQRMLDEIAGPGAMDLLQNKYKPLQRLSVSVLREYLAYEFSILSTLVPFRWDFERVVDDIVFMCFFVGNDFLPHLPSLDIRDGALDFLFNVYKRILPGLGNYLSSPGGIVNLKAVDIILSEVGLIEDYVFGMRYENEDAVQKRRDSQKCRNEGKRLTNITSDSKRYRNEEKKLTHFNSVPKVAAASKFVGRSARALFTTATKAEERTVAPALRTSSKVGDNVPLGRKKVETTFLQMTPDSYGDGDGTLRKRKSENNIRIGGGTIKISTTERNIAAAKRLKNMISSRPLSKSGPTLANFTSSASQVSTAKNDHDGNLQTLERFPNENNNQSNLNENVIDNKGASSDDNEFEPSIMPEVADKEITEEEVASAKALFKDKVKEATRAQLDKHAAEVVDNVRLHETGWRDRYYRDKCKAEDIEGRGGREELFRQYIMGLAWVMRYYYHGVASWKWYFPFHYAPFASDLKNIIRFEKDCKSFELRKPFSPVEQLMAVLPEDSNHAVPVATRSLMSEKSCISDFYPKVVKCDPNGKAMPWLWVVLLPFIDEDRLFAALEPKKQNWTKKDHLCNARGLDDGYIYVHQSNPLASAHSYDIITNEKSSLGDASLWNGFTGFVRFPLDNEKIEYDTTIPAPPRSCLGVIDKNRAICVAFSEPEARPHRSEVIRGAIPPPATLQTEDRYLKKPRLNRGGKTIAFLGSTPFSEAALQQNQGGGGRDHLPRNKFLGNNIPPGGAFFNNSGGGGHNTSFHHPPPSFVPGRSDPRQHGRGGGGYKGPPLPSSHGNFLQPLPYHHNSNPYQQHNRHGNSFGGTGSSNRNFGQQNVQNFTSYNNFSHPPPAPVGVRPPPRGPPPTNIPPSSRVTGFQPMQQSLQSLVGHMFSDHSNGGHKNNRTSTGNNSGGFQSVPPSAGGGSQTNFAFGEKRNTRNTHIRFSHDGNPGEGKQPKKNTHIGFSFNDKPGEGKQHQNSLSKNKEIRSAVNPNMMQHLRSQLATTLQEKKQQQQQN